MKMNILHVLLFLCSSLVLSAASTLADEAAPAQVQESFPGLEQVVPRSSSLVEESGNAIPLLTYEESIEKFNVQLSSLEASQLELTSQLSEWGEVSTWPLNRLLEARTRLSELRKRNQDILSSIAQPLKNLESLRSKWSEKQEFWSKWEDYLKTQNVTLPTESFRQSQQVIKDVIEKSSRTSKRFIELQQEVSKFQEKVTDWSSQIDGTLASVRKLTFMRNAYPMFSGEYFDQFNKDLFVETSVNIRTTFKLPATYFQQYGWVLFVQTFIFVLIVAMLAARKRKAEPITDEWRFLFDHKWAAGFFITLLSTGVLYSSPPPIWQLTLLIIGAISAVTLITADLDNVRAKRTVLVLAALFIVSEACKIVGLPRPVYRLYLVIICLVAIPVCLSSARKETRDRNNKVTLLSAGLYLGAFIGGFGLLTQLVGFATLTTNLIDATLGTVFVILVAQMALHLSDGGISEALRIDWIKNRTFVKRLGRRTDKRLKQISRLFIYGFTSVYLLYTWNIFTSPADAWDAIINWGIDVGELNLSVGTLLLALAAIYVTFLSSWVFQAFLDSQILTPQRTDRGVKDAVKKLVHYALILIGFFVAISVAGVGLEKFAIVAGALGVGIGFGLQNIVNNFISGLILLFERPIKVGDTINIDEQWGTITKIGLRSTVFETLDRSEIIVPNSELISQKVTNWTFTTNVSRIVLAVGVAYGSPLDKVLGVLHKVANNHPDILEDPEPSAIFTGFGDSSIDFELRVWVDDINKRLKVKSELGQAVDKYFREEGITIPFPQRDLHIKSIEPEARASFSDGSARL